MEDVIEELAVSGGKQQAWMFYCPGCKEHHHFMVGDPTAKPNWTWNGDKVKPTFAPSLLYRALPNAKDKSVCHSFVRNGNIEFLGDCTHELAGQTVPLSKVGEFPSLAD